MTKPKSTSKGWEKEWDDMWFDPGSTIFNWSGMFREQGFIEKLFGLGEWQDSSGTALKETLHSFLKDYIRSLLHSNREEVIREIDKLQKACNEADGLIDGITALHTLRAKLQGEQK